MLRPRQAPQRERDQLLAQVRELQRTQAGLEQELVQSRAKLGRVASLEGKLEQLLQPPLR